jgi:Tol biopolymer transport system component
VTTLNLFRVISLATCLALASAHVALATAPIQQLTDDPASDLRPAWSPDGKRIAFQSNRNGTYQVYLVDPDGSNERPISTADSDDRHPAWSPDGSLIAVDSGGETLREIWMIDVATGARTQVTRLAAIASFPSWGPNGTISFYLYRDGVLDLWSVGSDGTNPRPLTNGLASEQNNQCTFACHAAAWSPDGGRLAYATADQAQVWTMRASDGGDPVRVSSDGDGGRSHFPAYLPDGRLMYVTEHVTPGRSWTDVWAVWPGGPEPREAVLRDVPAQGPFEFSSDGQRMLFSSPRSGNFDIFLVPLTPEGKAALKVQSADAEPAPALGARLPGQEAETRAPASSRGSTPAGGSPLSASVFLLGLAGIGVLWLAVEIGLRVRGGSKRSNGR